MKSVAAFLLLFTWSTAEHAEAQLPALYGARIGATLAHQKFESKTFPIETHRRLGFSAAVFAEWLDVPYLSIITEVEYSQRGMTEKFNVTGPAGPEVIGVKTMDNRLDYLSIPLLLKVKLPVPVLTPYTVLGPRADFLLSYKSEDHLWDSVYRGFKKRLVGGTLGLGATIPKVVPFTLILEARYNLDFADSYSTDNLKVRNNSFDIWVGAAF